MKLQQLIITAGVIALSVYGAKNWTQGSQSPGGAMSPRAQRASTGELDIKLRLGFKGRGRWIEDREDRKIYLLGSVTNRGDSRVERLVVEAVIRDEGSLGEPERHRMVLGPCEAGETQTYEDLVTYILPSGEDAHGNEVFEFRYDLEVVPES